MGVESFNNVIEEQDKSEIDTIYQNLQSLFISETGDIIEWLNNGGEVLPGVFEEYIKANPNFINEWNNLDRRENVISDIRSRIESVLKARQGETDEGPKLSKAA